MSGADGVDNVRSQIGMSDAPSYAGVGEKQRGAVTDGR